MFRKKRLNRAVNSVIAASLSASMASSIGAAQLEEVIVTATKMEASAQDISVAVSALTSEKLDQMGVSNFEDYLIQLPGVTAGGSGPGQNTIYIRGVASTTPNLTTAGVAGLAPNVAFYLDEQPLAQPGRNLDVYAADLQRVEVLSGPQGTLFGASSQSGTVRLITNKPDFTGTYGRIKAGISNTQKGEESNNIEFMFNAPISENLAIRGVAYRDDKGGYIDNVHGTVNLLESARFREAGTMRSNGEPVSTARAGMQTQTYIESIQGLAYQENRVPLDPSDPSSYAQVNFINADNSALVEEDFNDATYEGIRLSALANIGDDWSLLFTYATQDLETDGVFAADPTLGAGDLSAQRYTSESMEDSFDNFSLKLEGRIGDLEVVYAGSYTNRETDQMVDYTDYLYTAQYLPYYICDTMVSYPEYNYYVTFAEYADNVPKGTCYAPNTYAPIMNEIDVTTHEIRISTNQDKSVRLTAGAFYSDSELKERVSFRYPGYLDSWFYGFYKGADGPTNYAQPGYADPGAFASDELFRNDVMRTDEQLGLFGELTFDITDKLSITAGARYYDVEVDLEGSANGSFGNMFWATDLNSFGTDISDLYDGDGRLLFINDTKPATKIVFERGVTFDEVKAQLAEVDGYSVGRGAFACAPNAICDTEIQAIVNATNAPNAAETDGVIAKLTLSYRTDSDVLVYGTYSEGFRPGLLNRPGGAAKGEYIVPFAVDSDDVTNIEIGWKADLLDGSMRFNGNVFFVDVEKMQTTMFDPGITNLFFSDNAANAEVKGLEADLLWAPNSVDGLTISAAVSFLDTEVTDVLLPSNDVRAGDELAYAPEFQGNLQARYEWDLASGLLAHVMPHMATSSKSYSDIIRMNRDEIGSWTMLGISAGVSSDTWSAELYVDNLTDERAEIARNFVFDRQRVTYARPRTVGARFIMNF